MKGIIRFKGGECYEFLGKYLDVTPHTTYLEFTIGNKFYYYEFNLNHTIRNKTIYDLCKII